MSPTSFNGKNILHRGKEADPFNLVSDNEWVTLKFGTQDQLKNARNLFGPNKLKKLKTGYYRVKVKSTSERDELMKSYRGKKGICHHVYKQKGKKGSRYILTDRIIIRFRDSVSRKDITDLLKQEHLGIIKKFRGNTQTMLVQVGHDAAGNPVKVANHLMTFDGYSSIIEFAEPNLINEFNKCYEPGDEFFSNQWHLKSWDDEDSEVDMDADISATAAWDITRGDRSVVVAVMDDGFYLNHMDLSGNDKIKFPLDFIDYDYNPVPGPGDYHGTSCAGLALAEDNSHGTVGVAPNCSFMPVRFNIQCEDSELVRIFEEVGSKADIISCSWGYNPGYYHISTLLYETIANIVDRGGPNGKGCVICFAAGNFNSPLLDIGPGTFKVNYPGIPEVDKPIINGLAAHPKVVTVAASTSLNKKALYSNWGDEITVCAPSDNVNLSSVRNIPSPGLGLYTIAFDQADTESGYSSFTHNFGGTSGATPIVAGVAALMRSVNPGLPAQRIIELLCETTDQIKDFDTCPIHGTDYGKSYSGKRNKWFGFGKVNAEKAVNKALNETPGLSVASQISFVIDSPGTLNGDGSFDVFNLKLGKRLIIELEGAEDADFDLYLKRNAVPTADNYDYMCASENYYERIMIEDIEPGNYYIMVYSYSGQGDYRLKAFFE